MTVQVKVFPGYQILKSDGTLLANSGDVITASNTDYAAIPVGTSHNLAFYMPSGGSQAAAELIG